MTGRCLLAMSMLLVAASCSKRSGDEKAQPPAADAAVARAPAPPPAPPDAGQRKPSIEEKLGLRSEDLTATPATCDPAGKPSRAWAYQQYLKEGGDEMDHAYVELFASVRVPDLWELDEKGGPHRPKHVRLVWIWRCRLYRDEAKLQQTILRDWGWQAADGARRVELAETIDRGFNEVVTEQPTDWDAKHAFAPPAAKALPGGGVRLVRWLDEYRVISGLTGESEASYVREQIDFRGRAMPSRPKQLAKQVRKDARGGGIRLP